MFQIFWPVLVAVKPLFITPLLCSSRQRSLPPALDTPPPVALVPRGEGGEVQLPTSSSHILQQTDRRPAERQRHGNLQLQLLQSGFGPRRHLCLCQRLDLRHPLAASGQIQNSAPRNQSETGCEGEDVVSLALLCSFFRGRRVITWEVLVNDCHFLLRLLFPCIPSEPHGTIYH